MITTLNSKFCFYKIAFVDGILSYVILMIKSYFPQNIVEHFVITLLAMLIESTIIWKTIAL